jgi:cytochrome c oxidase subunit 1
MRASSVFSRDHKVVGLQYGVTSLLFLLFGFTLVLLIRWQLAHVGAAAPWLLRIAGPSNAPGGIMAPEFYNQLGAMHGTIMVFLAVVPLAVGAFGNYLVPLMIGAPDMAFPRLNMLSFWIYAAAGVTMLVSFVLPGGAANSGWTSYPPLSIIATTGQTWWLCGMCLLIVSSLFSSINIITTIVQLRAPGMRMMDLPFFVWSQLVTSFLLLLAFPPLQGAAILQLMDRLAHTSFFLPTGLMVSDRMLNVSGGGSPILWQHLFWFLAHPEVYVLILPAFGIVAHIIANETKKPLWGQRLMVYASLFMAFMSFLVWAHHMFLTGMGPAMSAFFQVTTMIISIPSVIIVTGLLLSLYGGSIRFTVPMMFALAFLPMFGLGGLTGLPLGLAATDIPLHDTYYVVGHFHYIVAPGTLFALFAGIYYWFPRVTGKKLNDFWGQVHFWGSLVGMNGIFLPMFIQGLAGVNRRLYDGGLSYPHAAKLAPLNTGQFYSAVFLGVVQLAFIGNFVWTLWKRRRDADDNPWDATTLEWAVPQTAAAHAPIRFTTERRYDTGVTNVTLGFWLFLASEVMLFGALFSAYALLRVSADAWPHGREVLDVRLALTNTALLLIASIGAWIAARGRIRLRQLGLAASLIAAAGFVGLKLFEYRAEIAAGTLPRTSTFFATYFTLTGLHAVHVIGAIVAGVVILATSRRAGDAVTAGRLKCFALYWGLVEIVWLAILGTVYLS